MVVDGTDFRRQEPFLFTKEVNPKWFTLKFKSAGFRWEVGTSIKRGDICWINGPFPPGLMPDIIIFCLNLKQLLMAGAKVIADKGCRGDTKTCTPFEAKNKAHERAMSLGGTKL